jgi:putative ABC transport system permease protein
VFIYQLRMTWKSLRRAPAVSALMVGAIALGIGVCTTSITIYHLMSTNPISSRNSVLFSVTLDNGDPYPSRESKHPELPPMQLTYRDATALLDSPIPDRRVAMYKSEFVLEPPAASHVKRSLVASRMTTRDFFSMFAVPIQFGGAWTEQADEDAQHAVILSKETNDRVFGGENSVGKTLRLDGRDYLITGVLKEWSPAPRFYDLNNGPLAPMEDVFVPFSAGIALEQQTRGNTSCWGENKRDSYQGLLSSDCVWIQFWAEIGSPGQVAAFQNYIDNYVREQKKLGRFERPLNNHLRKPDEWLAINEVVPNDNRVLVGLSLMFLMVCLLNMSGLLLAKFLGASSLVGLRRALGASRSMVFREHLIEVGLLGLIGGMVGVVLAEFGLVGVRHLYRDFDQLTKLDWQMVGLALCIAIVSGVITGLYPAWRVCRMQPAICLKE